MSADEKFSEKKKAIKRIWKIRDNIQDLEEIKNGIIDFLSSRKKLDEVTKNLWISDVKDVYYNTVSAWEMLNSASKGKLEYLENSRNFLHIARGRLAKSISELKFYKEEIVFNLIKEVEISFEKCWNVFYLEFERLIPSKKIITYLVQSAVKFPLNIKLVLVGSMNMNHLFIQVLRIVDH